MAGFRVKIHNDGDSDYSEELNHKSYRIPRRGFIEVTRSEGVALMGSYPGKGVVKPLRLEHLPNADAQNNRYPCNLCNAEFTDMAQLNLHLNTHKGTFGQTPVVAPAKEQEQTKSAVKIYVCSGCETEHADKESLARCMASHKPVRRKRTVRVKHDSGNSVPVGG